MIKVRPQPAEHRRPEAVQATTTAKLPMEPLEGAAVQPWGCSCHTAQSKGCGLVTEEERAFGPS